MTTSQYCHTFKVLEAEVELLFFPGKQSVFTQLTLTRMRLMMLIQHFMTINHDGTKIQSQGAMFRSEDLFLLHLYFEEDEENTCMALPPYLCVLLDGNELQVWVLDVLFHCSVQVWLHRNAVSLVQEIKRGKCILGKGTRKKQHSNME